MSEMTSSQQDIQKLMSETRNLDVVERARKIATAAHADQTREDGQPYIVHPSRVVDRIEEAGLSTDSAVAAAWLHDVVEDTDWSISDIEELFGKTIAQLVSELTLILPKKWPRDITYQQGREIKTLALVGKAVSMSPEAKIIKLADRIDNLTSAKKQWKPERLQNYAVQASKFIWAMDLTCHDEMRFLDAYIALRKEASSLVTEILGYHDAS